MEILPQKDRKQTAHRIQNRKKNGAYRELISRKPYPILAEAENCISVCCRLIWMEVKNGSGSLKNVRTKKTSLIMI